MRIPYACKLRRASCFRMCNEHFLRDSIVSMSPTRHAFLETLNFNPHFRNLSAGLFFFKAFVASVVLGRQWMFNKCFLMGKLGNHTKFHRIRSTLTRQDSLV